MATTKKGKKTAKPKKGSSKKKKGNGSMNFFSKLILTLLLLSIVTIAVFLVMGNFKINNDSKPKTEVVKTEKQQTEKKELKKESEKKESVKKETEKKTEKETEKEPVKPEVKTEEKKQENKTQTAKTLKGCWLCSEQGASITMDEFGYRIDFFGVDASNPMTGNYRIENNLIVFENDDNECKGTGTYRITFYKDNFSLICKDDECKKRRNILEADWEWIEL